MSGIKGAPPVDLERAQMAVRMMQADYKFTMREAHDGLRWLRGQIDDAERSGLDAPFTPGNMGSTVAKVEAARWKAKALREALLALGQTPEAA